MLKLGHLRIKELPQQNLIDDFANSDGRNYRRNWCRVLAYGGEK